MSDKQPMIEEDFLVAKNFVIEMDEGRKIGSK